MIHASVRRGDLADLDGLKQGAAEADGVIHLALFDSGHMRPGDMGSASAAVHALGDVLAGTGKPLVSAAAIGALGPLGRPSTEADPAAPGGPTNSEIAVVSLAGRGVRSSVVRLPLITEHLRAPRVRGNPDRHRPQYRGRGLCGVGANRWPDVHTLDAGHLYRLALENAGAGTRWHAVADEGISMREIAQTIAEHLNIPAANIPDDRLEDHFGLLARLIGSTSPLPAS